MFLHRTTNCQPTGRTLSSTHVTYSLDFGPDVETRDLDGAWAQPTPCGIHWRISQHTGPGGNLCGLIVGVGGGGENADSAPRGGLKMVPGERAPAFRPAT